ADPVDLGTADPESLAAGKLSELPTPGRVILPKQVESLQPTRNEPSTAGGRKQVPSRESFSAGGRKAESKEPFVVDIACGERHSLLLDDLGRVYSFGENLAGQCGVPDSV
ncbi:unnamed protein product, partial [Polarella glacialis]